MQLLSIPCFIFARQKKKIQFVIILITYRILQLDSQGMWSIMSGKMKKNIYFFPNNIYMTIT